MSKFPFFIAFIKVLCVGPKQRPCRYWIRSVLVLSHVMIAWARCLNCLEMGMSHNPSVLFLCNFKISMEYLRLLISFLSKMVMQSSSHSCPKDIS